MFTKHPEALRAVRRLVKRVNERVEEEALFTLCAAFHHLYDYAEEHRRSRKLPPEALQALPHRARAMNADHHAAVHWGGRRDRQSWATMAYLLNHPKYLRLIDRCPGCGVFVFDPRKGRGRPLKRCGSAVCRDALQREAQRKAMQKKRGGLKRPRKEEPDDVVVIDPRVPRARVLSFEFAKEGLVIRRTAPVVDPRRRRRRRYRTSSNTPNERTSA